MQQQRMGIGYDAHRLVAGRRLVLGGVRIEHELGLDGHSDADVLCHAISDALLGAIAGGDIGDMFPDEDPYYKDAASTELLGQIVARLVAENWRISNIDATVIAQLPRLSPYREAMRSSIARVCSLDIDQVSVKATTTEGMGFCGRGEGIAAQAIASVLRGRQ